MMRWRSIPRRSATAPSVISIPHMMNVMKSALLLIVLSVAALPQVAPVMASQCLFYLEANFRHAAVLGLVGAGGIGFELQERIRIYAFDQVAFIVLLYMLAVAVLDTVSRALRKRLG